MPNITNDQQLRSSLERLDIPMQQRLAGLFADNVAKLGKDPRLAQIREIAISPAADSQLRHEAYRTARSLATGSYTACGQDVDWLDQAEHFVAAAFTTALTGGEQAKEHLNLAWEAAMQARMANNCAMMASISGDIDNEAQKQYRIAGELLG